MSRVYNEALGDIAPLSLTSLCFREQPHLPGPGVSREAVGMVGHVCHSKILLNVPRGVMWWPKWGCSPEMPSHLDGMRLTQIQLNIVIISFSQRTLLTEMTG